MIPVQILLIVIGALLADAQKCNCECDGNDVCDEQMTLRTVLYKNTAQLAKWNRHYNFVTSLATGWQSQVAHVVREQLKVGTNESVDGLKNPLLDAENSCCAQNEDIQDRLEYLELSVSELQEQATELESTMEKISDEMHELTRESHDNDNNPVCSPPCANGGQCVRKNVCNCTSSFYGDRCKDGPKCGVDSPQHSGSDRVFPWIAAMYDKENKYGCDGSIINHHFILTSAWCMSYFASDGLSVKLGLSDLEKRTYLQEIKVITVHRHPQFRGGPRTSDNHDFDITLLELERPIKFGPFVSPICLPSSETSQGEPFYEPLSIATAVYLDKYIKAPQNESPMTLSFTIQPHDYCRGKLRELRIENKFPTQEDSFCARTNSVPAHCPRDGSPIMKAHLTEHGTRVWTQVGIRSWMWFGCDLFFIPRLDRLRPWIEKIIAASSSQ